MIFLPIISTDSGSALIAQDWASIGIDALSLYLDALLVKPGIELLKALPKLSTYVGWDKTIVLNASRLKVSNTGEYRVRSQFDGRILTYTKTELIDVILQLNPDYLVLPDLSWLTELTSTSIRLLPPRDNLSRENLASCWYSLDHQTICLRHEDVIWHETEIPVVQAIDGIVYTDEDSVLDLKLPSMANVFHPLSKKCPCEACQLGLTVSYFHHLLTHTPGLCQRFLIQHNAANYSTSSFCRSAFEHNTTN
jgi:queuine tRNA-ribosyltransferase